MGEHWIVVGAGSAGCVLANRLSADPTRHVTLLDDGPDLIEGAVPAGINAANFFAAWVEPGRIHNDLVARRTLGAPLTPYVRGRGVGGSSAVNAMVALRGDEQIYRRWGWDDTTDAWDRMLLTTRQVDPTALAPVLHALLAADSRAEWATLTMAGPRRVTSAEAYLWPIRRRSNLEVLADSPVDIVNFDGRRAVGVTLLDGTELTADRVILSAGAIHSPTIALRSGVDTPGLGEGLQDHPSAVFTLQLKDHRVVTDADQTIGSHLHVRVGDDLIQIMPMANLGLEQETAGLGALLVALMTPTGRSGTVTIDPAGQPVVDLALLDDERDLDALAGGVELAIETLSHQAFDDVIDQAFIDDVGTPLATLTDRKAIRTWLQARCGDYVHASSSCAMGTVVDERGAVNGYEGLYICDASIFPTIPDANTHLPTTMAAERLCTPGRLLPD